MKEFHLTPMTCPLCGEHNTKKNGWYENNRDRIQKYFCKECQKDFTAVTEDQDRNEHKPELNKKILELHEEGMSQRDIAAKLKCSRTTVQRKLSKYL